MGEAKTGQGARWPPVSCSSIRGRPEAEAARAFQIRVRALSTEDHCRSWVKLDPDEKMVVDPRVKLQGTWKFGLKQLLHKIVVLKQTLPFSRVEDVVTFFATSPAGESMGEA